MVYAEFKERHRPWAVWVEPHKTAYGAMARDSGFWHSAVQVQRVDSVCPGRHVGCRTNLC